MKNNLLVCFHCACTLYALSKFITYIRESDTYFFSMCSAQGWFVLIQSECHVSLQIKCLTAWKPAIARARCFAFMANFSQRCVSSDDSRATNHSRRACVEQKASRRVKWATASSTCHWCSSCNLVLLVCKIIGLFCESNLLIRSILNILSPRACYAISAACQGLK